MLSLISVERAKCPNLGAALALLNDPLLSLWDLQDGLFNIGQG
jgi:hypothetical protein